MFIAALHIPPPPSLPLNTSVASLHLNTSVALCLDLILGQIGLFPVCSVSPVCPVYPSLFPAPSARSARSVSGPVYSRSARSIPGLCPAWHGPPVTTSCPCCYHMGPMGSKTSNKHNSNQN